MECRLKSHPDRLLKEHLYGCVDIGLKLFSNNKLFNFDEDFIRAILLFHDIGKASKYFQDYLSGKKVNRNLRKHSEISALWFYFYAIEELKLSQKKASLGYSIIKSHHSDLDDIQNMLVANLDYKSLLSINDAIDYGELSCIFKPFLNKSLFTREKFIRFYKIYTNEGSIKNIRKIKKEISLKDYFFLNYFFSILLSADKGEVILGILPEKSNSVWISDMVDNYIAPFYDADKGINKLRSDAYAEVASNIISEKYKKKRFFSINLPTGAGKTLNSLNAAVKLKTDNPGIQKIIYCLPFTSVIDQNASVFEDVLLKNSIVPGSNLLLKQHHLSELSYTRNSRKEYLGQEAEYLMEGWESELIITTFYQFLYTLLSNRNKALRKFHNISHSVVILDEVQNIPFKYWMLINTILKEVAEILDLYVILVTATMPLIFSEKKGEILELASSKAKYFFDLNRIKLDLTCAGKITKLEDFCDLLLKEIVYNKDESFLIILNTIKSSIFVYKYLKEKINSDRLLYLSSNIIPIERLKRIKKIKENSSGKVIVSTQVVEAGVDIDVECVYRDMAPLDSIFQACGRCNRNNERQTATVKIFNLYMNNRDLSSLIYDPVLINHTKNIIGNSRYIEEKDFLDLSKKYYNELQNILSVNVSTELIKAVSSLKYKKAFESSDSIEKFSLIDSFPTVSAFIGINEKAMDIINRFYNISEKEFDDPFKKRIEMKKIRKEMSSFMINVPESIAKKNGYSEDNGPIWILPDSIINKHYDEEIGFKRDQEPVDYIL